MDSCFKGAYFSHRAWGCYLSAPDITVWPCGCVTHRSKVLETEENTPEIKYHLPKPAGYELSITAQDKAALSSLLLPWAKPLVASPRWENFILGPPLPLLKGLSNTWAAPIPLHFYCINALMHPRSSPRVWFKQDQDHRKTKTNTKLPP